MCGDQDVTLEKDYESLIGNIPGESWTSYKVDSDVNPDAILENFYSVTQPSGITQLFQQGLNYYTVDPADDSWLVLTQPIYPSYNYQLNCPVLLGDGFSVSDENMVVLSRTIRNTDGDAFNCIILKLTGDIHISFIMHEIEYTMLEIECNDNEGEVLVDPEKNLDPNFWFEGTLVTLQARPKQGFKFVKWECSSGDVITDVNNMFNPISFTLGSEPVSMIPVFEPATACERSVLTSVNPQEKAVIYVNGSDSVVSVLEGSVVNLSLSVNEYYLFDHWEVYQNGVEELNNLVTPAM